MIVPAFLIPSPDQSALAPAGFHARQIAGLWNIFLVVCAVVFVLVMMALIAALLRRGTQANSDEPAPRAAKIVAAAAALSAAVLFALLAGSILTGRRIAEVPTQKMQVLVTGKQWWWQVDYEDPDVSRRVTTANEITIPVGVPVNVRLHSSDVIHSFWVPGLNGKRDLIPGHDGSLTIQAEKAGVFRGQCAEFCGVQHANMAFWVNALEPADYQRWISAQRLPGKVPSSVRERQGQQVFMNSPCPLCHNIQGTEAGGRTGPDLTHFAGRRSIAAGTLPNTRENLEQWIVDPQHFKPGNQMPSMLMSRDDLAPLVDYLESLQ